MAEDPPVVDPHEVDEDPETLMGAVVPDPWSDNTQTDWPNHELADEPEESDDDSDEPAFVDKRDNVEVID